ncbi:hypothetical protein LX32DRAFT_639980 [Colletotrichum zoysiae]|uniref:Uncharacterized protein n=1 Tax=Colletotrichum zoysiae TaxID=1216348 RepID=A0AAD9M0W1_9PEZI|nr:hypothetical protein LX32DRAFT_639980 [Colletotrichum zoysiae]
MPLSVPLGGFGLWYASGLTLFNPIVEVLQAALRLVFCRHHCSLDQPSLPTAPW